MHFKLKEKQEERCYGIEEEKKKTPGLGSRFSSLLIHRHTFTSMETSWSALLKLKRREKEAEKEEGTQAKVEGKKNDMPQGLCTDAFHNM